MCCPVMVNLVYTENHSSSKSPLTAAAVNKTSGRIRKATVHNKEQCFFVVKQSQRQFYSPEASSMERLSNFQRFMTMNDEQYFNSRSIWCKI
jgi:hypothetical protein